MQPTTAAGRAAVEAAEKAYTQGFDITMIVSAAIIGVMGLAAILVMGPPASEAGQRNAGAPI